MKGIVSLGSIISGTKSSLSKKSAPVQDHVQSLTIELYLDESGNPRIYNGHHRIVAMLSIGYTVTGVVHPTGDKYNVTVQDDRLTYTKI